MVRLGDGDGAHLHGREWGGNGDRTVRERGWIHMELSSQDGLELCEVDKSLHVPVSCSTSIRRAALISEARETESLLSYSAGSVIPGRNLPAPIKIAFLFLSPI